VLRLWRGILLLLFGGRRMRAVAGVAGMRIVLRRGGRNEQSQRARKRDTANQTHGPRTYAARRLR
jgi:hypothetical protein